MNLSLFFYLGTCLQLIGLASVGLCFISGVQHGDYGRVELAQLMLGSFVFYIGNYFKAKSAS